MAGQANQGESKETELVRIAAARGIFFQTAEIFGSNLSGFWEYGPIGLRILNNLMNEWRVLLDEVNAHEISGSIILPRKVLQASGHEKNFFDPLVSCKRCGSVYRVDKILQEREPSQRFEGLSEEEYSGLIDRHGLRCSKCGGEFNRPKRFGLMIGSRIGATDELNAYLRPEACQSIFLDFKRVFETYAGKRLPLVMAQTGKAFRNEISPRNNLIRQREFYQSDIEVFFLNSEDFVLHRSDDIEINVFDSEHAQEKRLMISVALKIGIIEESVTAYWTSKWIRFLERMGFESDDIRLKKLHKEKPFYAKEAFDLEIRKENDDWVEVTGIHHRNDYDLTEYERYGASVPKVDGRTPNVFEISAGTDRIFYLLLYKSMKSSGERRWLSLKEEIAPYRYGIFPLQKDDKLIEKAKEVYALFRKKGIDAYYSETGSIGKRYAKADEIGVPYAVTCDYQTLEDETVTIRNRDTTRQVRKRISELR